jgi:membrane protease YdiL (CAAX protease family)
MLLQTHMESSRGDSADLSTTVLIGRAVLIGTAIALAGTIPRNILFALNLRFFASVPWAVPVTGIYLWFFWKRLKSSDDRGRLLRANPLTVRAWLWALSAGLLGIVALVLGLSIANRFVALPGQQLPNFAGVPQSTVLSLLVAAAPIAGLIEESAFRGYMQGPIERRCGLPVAILITGSMFALVHLDFTPILWPYYVAVAALYSVVTSLSNSILPAIVLHTLGNTYSNFDLWLHGKSEWQTAPGRPPHTWDPGAAIAFAAVTAALSLMCFAFFKLSASGKPADTRR